MLPPIGPTLFGVVVVVAPIGPTPFGVVVVAPIGPTSLGVVVVVAPIGPTPLGVVVVVPAPGKGVVDVEARVVQSFQPFRPFVVVCCSQSSQVPVWMGVGVEEVHSAHSAHSAQPGEVASGSSQSCQSGIVVSMDGQSVQAGLAAPEGRGRGESGIALAGTSAHKANSGVGTQVGGPALVKTTI